MPPASKLFLVLSVSSVAAFAVGWGHAGQAAPVASSADARAAGEHGVSGEARPQVDTTKAPLSEEECSKLGGKVENELMGLCLSGKYCATVDESGKNHAVCISKR
jgi:hypothetical protein